MKAYITDRELLKRSKHHTVYVGEGAISDDPRKPNPIYKLEFVNGVARDVDPQNLQRFKDAGHCSEEPPRIYMPDDDDDSDRQHWQR